MGGSGARIDKHSQLRSLLKNSVFIAPAPIQEMATRTVPYLIALIYDPP